MQNANQTAKCPRCQRRLASLPFIDDVLGRAFDLLARHPLTKTPAETAQLLGRAAGSIAAARELLACHSHTCSPPKPVLRIVRPATTCPSCGAESVPTSRLDTWTCSVCGGSLLTRPEGV